MLLEWGLSERNRARGTREGIRSARSAGGRRAAKAGRRSTRRREVGRGTELLLLLLLIWGLSRSRSGREESAGACERLLSRRESGLLGECRLSRLLLLLLAEVDGLWSDDVSRRRDVAREGRRGRLVGRRHCRIHRRKGRSLLVELLRRRRESSHWRMLELLNGRGRVGVLLLLLGDG